MSETDKKVTRQAGIVVLGTLTSRIFGLVRESVIAAYFPKQALDAFMVAFMLPNLFRRLTAEGAFSISVISIFAKIWSRGDLAESQRFARAVFGFSLIFLTALAVLGVIGARELTVLAGGGFSEYPDKFALAVSLTRFMFPYILLISLTSIAMGLLNSAGHFFAPAFGQVLLNVAIVACAVAFTSAMPGLGWNPIFAVAIGVLVGGVAQLAFQLPALWRKRLLVRPTLEFRHPGLVQVLKLTAPMVFGAAAYQVHMIIATNFASQLGHGAVTYIQFSNRLLELPQAVLVMAISTAALPNLAVLKGQGRIDDMKNTYRHSLRLALFVATPATIGLFAIAEPITSVLYQRGHFSYADALATASASRWLAVGTCSLALVRQTVPVFYAMEQTVVPVLMGLVSIGVYIASALALRNRFGVAGLCMASSLAVTAQGLGLVLVLRQRIGRLGLSRTLKSWVRMLLAAGVMTAAVYPVSTLGCWSAGGNSPRNIAVLAAAILVAPVAYGIGAHLFRSPELADLLASVKRRSKKAAP